MPKSTFRTIDSIDVSGKRVLVRVDLNVPMKNGKVTDATRIERAAPTLGELAAKGAKVIVLSHFGRPDGKRVPEMSLKPWSNHCRRRSAGRWPSPTTASARWPKRQCAGSSPARSCCSRTCASTRKRRRTTRISSTSSRCWATPTSTTPSPPRTAPMPRPRASPTACPSAAGRLMQAELEALDKALGNPRAAGLCRSSAAPRCRPSSICWAISSARSTG
jgi:phosphoglycerate kinase